MPCGLSPQVSASVATLESEWALELAKKTLIEAIEAAVPGKKSPSSASDAPAGDVVADKDVPGAVDEGRRN